MLQMIDGIALSYGDAGAEALRDLLLICWPQMVEPDVSQILFISDRTVTPNLKPPLSFSRGLVLLPTGAAELFCRRPRCLVPHLDAKPLCQLSGCSCSREQGHGRAIQCRMGCAAGQGKMIAPGGREDM